MWKIEINNRYNNKFNNNSNNNNKFQLESQVMKNLSIQSKKTNRTIKFTQWIKIKRCLFLIYNNKKNHHLNNLIFNSILKTKLDFLRKHQIQKGIRNKKVKELLNNEFKYY
jgi:hypothetical protein